MSRVTLEQIHRDFELASNCQFSASRDIEVVPRKMVELIIGKCIEVEWENGGRMNDEPIQFGKSCAAKDIEEFAKSLLTKFEIGGNE